MQVIDYEWSPDSKWIARARGRVFCREMYIIPAAGGTPKNVTHATENFGIT